MNTIVILGAGQMGKSAELLLNKKEYKLLAFGDNAVQNNSDTNGILPIAEALALNPELAFVAVAAKNRGKELEKQAKELGYQGSVVRLDTLMDAIDIRSATASRIAERIKDSHICGAVAELGVYRGDFARLLNELFPDRKLYLFDTFEGFDERDINAEKQFGLSKAVKEEFSDTSVESVLAKMPYPHHVTVRQGFFPETCDGLNETFAFVSLDADLYAPTMAGLKWFLPRLSDGGVILLHDYNNPRFPGVKQAVADFEDKNGWVSLMPLCDVHGSAVIIRA